MEEEPIYHFKFGIRSASMSIPEHITTRRVPFSRLLESFDAALDWIETNPKKRYASVFGRGMMSRAVTESTREYILKNLPDNLPKKKSVIGLIWMDLRDKSKAGIDYRLHKFWKAEVPLPDLPERPETHYGYTEIATEDRDRAFEWVQANRWHDYGVWINSRPALVFTPDYQAVETACQSCLEMLPYLSQNKLHRAPVRYDWTQRELPYPRMVTKRPMPAIQKLRSRFPTAGDDMMVAPLEYLIWRHGYGLAR